MVTNHVNFKSEGVTSNSTLIGQFNAEVVNVHIPPATKKIEEILSPLNFFQTHKDIRGKRERGTGQWILETPGFKGWISHAGRTLLCDGPAGVGKTVLVSTIWDHMRSRFAVDIKSGKIGAACAYCSYNTHHDRTLSDLLASLWVQLVRMRGGSPDEEAGALKRTLDTYQTLPDLNDVKSLLLSEVRTYDRIFIIVDALDECSDEKGLLEELFSLLPTRLNLLLTSRHKLEGHITGVVDHLRIQSNVKDLELYIDSWMKRELSEDSECSPNYKDDIIRNIIQMSENTFLLVKLHINTLRVEKDPNHVLRAVRKLPIRFDEAYKSTINRIKSKTPLSANIARQVLYWLVFAHRPLTIQELQHALKLSHEETLSDISVDPNFLESICSGLVTVNEETKTVELIHLTTKRYLEKDQIEWFKGAQSIAILCLQLLRNFAQSHHRGNDEKPGPSSLVLYAAEHWGLHVKEELGVKTKQEAHEILEEARKFLQDTKTLEASVGVLGHSKHSYKGRTRVTGLHMVAYFGLSELVDLFIPPGQGINVKDNRGATALHWAARMEHLETVQQILKAKEIDINAKDNYGTTALHYAASNGNKGIVSVLLGHRAESKRFLRKTVNAQDRHRVTPLHYAVTNCHTEIVELLLEAGADVNMAERGGGTPLARAIDGGCRKIVQKLLERNAKVNYVYRLPEFEARWVEFGVSLWNKLGDCPKEYRFHRHWAVNILLGKFHRRRQRFNPTFQRWDNRRRLRGAQEIEEDEKSPLVTRILEAYQKRSFHSMYVWGDIFVHGSGKLVEFLANHERLKSKIEPLQWIEEKIRRLLGVSGILLYQYHRTPLSRAAENGEDGIVDDLLKRLGDHPKSSIFLRTPLSLAAANGHKEIVKYLTKRTTDADFKFMDGRTPLSYAAEGGHSDVVRFLLHTYPGKDMLEVDSRDTYVLCEPEFIESQHDSETATGLLDSRIIVGQTPLSYAAMNGQLEVVKALIKSGRVNVNLKDGKGRTPLSYAAENGHESVVLGLLELKETAIDISDQSGAIPESYAIMNGHDRIVRGLRQASSWVPWGQNCLQEPTSVAANLADAEPEIS